MVSQGELGRQVRPTAFAAAAVGGGAAPVEAVSAEELAAAQARWGRSRPLFWSATASRRQGLARCCRALPPLCCLCAQPCGCHSRQRPGRRLSSGGACVPSCPNCVTPWADLHVRAGAARRGREGGVDGRGAEPQRAPRPGRRQGRGRRSGAPPTLGPLASLRRPCCGLRAAAFPRAAGTAHHIAAGACCGRARRRARGGARGGADAPKCVTGPSWHTCGV